MNLYRFQKHEEDVGRLAQQLGFTNVSLSSHVMPMVRLVPRGFTACVDAYLTPLIKKYVEVLYGNVHDSLLQLFD